MCDANSQLSLRPLLIRVVVLNGWVKTCSSSPKMKFGVEHVLGDSEKIECIDVEINDLTFMSAIPLVDHQNMGFSVFLSTTTNIGV